MKIKFLITVILTGLFAVTEGQIPLIKANSDKADVRDGLHFRKGYWKISPASTLNKYYVETPRKDHRVTFYTDVDSIRFDVSYGGVYNFAILLNGKAQVGTEQPSTPQVKAPTSTSQYSAIAFATACCTGCSIFT